MANTSTDILAAIDAGSSKVLCVIARPSDTLEGCFKVLGFGRVPSQGIKNGIIYDVEKAVFSIRTALQEAQNSPVLFLDSHVVNPGAHVLAEWSKWMANKNN